MIWGYDKIIKKYERIFYKSLDNFDNPRGYQVVIRVNYKDDGTIDKYTLCIGTCAECGEEGIVGRGNDGQGLISAFRPHNCRGAVWKKREISYRLCSFFYGSKSGFEDIQGTWGKMYDLCDNEKS